MRNLYIATLALLASVFFTVGANAVTIGPIGPNSPLVVLAYPDDVIGTAFIPTANTPFVHSYEFQLGDSAASLNSLVFTGVSAGGFSVLNVALFDVAANVTLGTINGLTSSTPVLVSGLVSGGLYNLIFSGTTTSAGSLYAFNVSAVPVPPALLLLVSGLFGAGFMSRRKRAEPSISV